MSIRDMQFFTQQATQIAEHPVQTWVIELAGNGGINGDVLILHLEGNAVALPLFAHITQCIFCTALIKLVQHHKFGKIQHVDFFQLAGCAKVGGHHIHREIHQINDF